MTKHQDYVGSTLLLTGGVFLLSILWVIVSSRRRTSSRQNPPTNGGKAPLPPGPGWALPVLGHLHLVGSDPRKRFVQWGREHGEVFSLYLGGQLVVVLNGFPVIKEALCKQAHVFSHRPQGFLSVRLSQNRGIVFSSGPVWKEQRKAALEILREFGMGKNILADKIQEEISYYIQAIEDHQGQPFDLQKLTTMSVSNNTCSIIFGKRFEYDDPVFQVYLSCAEDNMRYLRGTAVLNFFPFLEYLPGDLFNAKKVLNNNKRVLEDFLQPQLDAHKNCHSAGDTASDFIHAYLRQMNRQQSSGKDTSLDEKNLIKTIKDLFVAGTETTSTLIRWILLHFLHYPEVQDKCYEELSDVVGSNRPPSMRDKAEMTYVEATIMEVLRRCNIAPIVQYATSCDVVFRGYFIPEGTVVLPNLDSVLLSPETWRDPDNFRPERFIDLDGKLLKPEEFIPFNTGHRSCLGKSLAWMQLFLYLSSLIQRFHFLPQEGEPLPSLQGVLGLTYSPKPYQIRAVLRD